jgi:hypothetical protein
MNLKITDIEVGGWFYCPEDYDGETRIYTIVGSDIWNIQIQFNAEESIDNGHWTLSGYKQWTSLWSIESTVTEIESKKLFYIEPDSYDKMMKQVMICNLKYRSYDRSSE